MATGLVLSIWRTFRYSRMASRYCSLLKYRSPRSRWRAFLASGDREHPATIRSAVSERTTDVRRLGDIKAVFGSWGLRNARPLALHRKERPPRAPLHEQRKRATLNAAHERVLPLGASSFRSTGLSSIGSVIQRVPRSLAPRVARGLQSPGVTRAEPCACWPRTPCETYRAAAASTRPSATR